MGRYLESYIQRDLEKKMVFIGGPRQCGKTTLAKSLLEQSSSGIYFNYDRDRDRRLLKKEAWSSDQKVLVFDEIHKYRNWKNWLKGLYDTEKDTHQFLVTGSARLNVYKRGGDSMLGRYHYWRLHPFSLSELPPGILPKEGFERLMRVGGFPEPFLDNSESAARRWRKSRQDLIVRDDVRDLENIKDINTLQLLIDLLKERVGSLVVPANLAEDLQVSQATIKKWIEVLEKMYFVFVVRPYSKNIPRALQKPFKVYFYDNAEVESDGDPGPVFENLVATHLLKRIEFLEDSTGYRHQLCFIRDREGREVDFAIIKEKKLETLIEAKLTETEVSKSLTYFAERLNPKSAIQILAHAKTKYRKNKLLVEPAQESKLLLTLDT